MVGPPFTTILQKTTPRPLLGKVIAIRSTVGNVSDAVSYIRMGALLEALPMSGVLGVGTFLAAASVGLFFPLWSRHSERLQGKNYDTANRKLRRTIENDLVGERRMARM